MTLWLEEDSSVPTTEFRKAVPDYAAIAESWQETAQKLNKNSRNFQKSRIAECEKNDQALSDSV